MAALDHREPDRVPVDFGGYPGATSINVEAYRRFKDYLGLGAEKELWVANPVMFTAEVDEEILDLFDIDTWCGRRVFPEGFCRTRDVSGQMEGDLEKIGCSYLLDGRRSLLGRERDP